MKTFYDLFNISENASDEEISNAYNTLKNKYLKYIDDPNNSEKAKQSIKKLDVAFQILGNPQSRASYNKDIENMRKNELMNNLQQNTNTHNQEMKVKEQIEAAQKSEEIRFQKEQERRNQEQEKIERERAEQEKIKKAKIEFVQNEIDKQILEQQNQWKAEQEARKRIRDAQNKAYDDAYKAYLNQMGIKEPMTIKKFLRTLGATILVLGVLFIIIQLPPVKEAIMNSEFVKFFSSLKN